MRHFTVPERPGWRRLAERLGFLNHTYGALPYWTDDACYGFHPWQIEEHLRPAARALWDMCLEVVDHASRDDQVLSSLGIPPQAWNGVGASWKRRDPALVSRLDLAYDGAGPPKLHECNADTPGGLFEAALFQWLWLEDALSAGALPSGCDQFNRLHEALVDAFRALPPAPRLHVAASIRNVEDQVWARYVSDCARQAGLAVTEIDLGAIGLDASQGLTDLDDGPIHRLVKAYRWDLMIREPFGPSLLRPAAPQIIEPAWKMILASKGLLVWLWRLFPGHPNLLPCWFDGDPGAPRDLVATKPLFAIKGRNVALHDPALPGGRLESPGPHGADQRVVQALHYLPSFARNGERRWACVGAWIVAGKPEGLGILEDTSPIIRDATSRFVPHVVLD